MDQLEKALDGPRVPLPLVMTGTGDRAFVSGGDLKELSAFAPNSKRRLWRSDAVDMRSDRRFPHSHHRRVERPCAWRRREFAVAADIRLAADDIKIGFNQ